MAIYVSGSLAFDRIFNFNGNLQEHLISEKLGTLSVSFMVDGMVERRGGCAGNIAYSLSLLGQGAVIICSAGKDFDNYAAFLQANGLTLEGIRRIADDFTATCYITTDAKGNQITGFYPGACNHSANYNFTALDAKRDLAIVSPGNLDDMRNLPKFYQAKGVRCIYDPGQQIPVLTKEDLLQGIKSSYICISNDYELSLICKKLDCKEADILQHCAWLITTLGADGQRLRRADGSEIYIKAAKCDKVLDPTGAGDAQRAGLLCGLALGLDVPEAAKIGAVTAAYSIECLGTQEHSYTKAEFIKRYKENFGDLPCSL